MCLLNLEKIWKLSFQGLLTFILFKENCSQDRGDQGLGRYPLFSIYKHLYIGAGLLWLNRLFLPSKREARLFERFGHRSLR